MFSYPFKKRDFGQFRKPEVPRQKKLFFFFNFSNFISNFSLNSLDSLVLFVCTFPLPSYPNSIILGWLVFFPKREWSQLSNNNKLTFNCFVTISLCKLSAFSMQNPWSFLLFPFVLPHANSGFIQPQKRRKKKNIDFELHAPVLFVLVHVVCSESFGEKINETFEECSV